MADEDRAVSAPRDSARESGKRLPMHPDVAREYLKQRAHHLTARAVAILQAKRELASREQEEPVLPDAARVFIEQRSHELMGQLEGKLKEKRELADKEQIEVQDPTFRDAEGASHE